MCSVSRGERRSRFCGHEDARGARRRRPGRSPLGQVHDERGTALHGIQHIRVCSVRR